jgi:hypothetical protein
MVSTLNRPTIGVRSDRAWWVAAAATVAGFVTLGLAQLGPGVTHGLKFTVYMLATGQWSADRAFGYIIGSLPWWVANATIVRNVLWTFVVYISWWGWEGATMAYAFLLSTGVGGFILGVLSGAVLG